MNNLNCDMYQLKTIISLDILQEKVKFGYTTVNVTE